MVEELQPISNKQRGYSNYKEYEEANYVNNSLGGYQRKKYKGMGQKNHGDLEYKGKVTNNGEISKVIRIKKIRATTIILGIVDQIHMFHQKTNIPILNNSERALQMTKVVPNWRVCLRGFCKTKRSLILQ